MPGRTVGPYSGLFSRKVCGLEILDAQQEMAHQLAVWGCGKVTIFTSDRMKLGKKKKKKKKRRKEKKKNWIEGEIYFSFFILSDCCANCG